MAHGLQIPPSVFWLIPYKGGISLHLVFSSASLMRTRRRLDAGTRRVPITKARRFKQGKHFLPPRL
ncbi:MAG: hypothetical protein KME21_15645 [Desmonostoc vinosum HA7617-LM4]|nr:hypothetical protein [Desmonostoc vinosum HA7617-LM4]